LKAVLPVHEDRVSGERDDDGEFGEVGLDVATEMVLSCSSSGLAVVKKEHALEVRHKRLDADLVHLDSTRVPLCGRPYVHRAQFGDPASCLLYPMAQELAPVTNLHQITMRLGTDNPGW
jgi:hypothetical protein